MRALHLAAAVLLAFAATGVSAQEEVDRRQGAIARAQEYKWMSFHVVEYEYEANITVRSVPEVTGSFLVRVRNDRPTASFIVSRNPPLSNSSGEVDILQYVTTVDAMFRNLIIGGATAEPVNGQLWNENFGFPNRYTGTYIDLTSYTMQMLTFTIRETDTYLDGLIDELDQARIRWQRNTQEWSAYHYELRHSCNLGCYEADPNNASVSVPVIINIRNGAIRSILDARTRTVLQSRERYYTIPNLMDAIRSAVNTYGNVNPSTFEATYTELGYPATFKRTEPNVEFDAVSFWFLAGVAKDEIAPEEPESTPGWIFVVLILAVIGIFVALGLYFCCRGKKNAGPATDRTMAQPGAQPQEMRGVAPAGGAPVAGAAPAPAPAPGTTHGGHVDYGDSDLRQGPPPKRDGVQYEV